MSLILAAPPGSNFFQPVVRFTAVWNAVTPGFYDFNSLGNTDVAFQRIRKNKLYIIERYSFSTTVEEGSFLQATENAGDVPSLSVRVPKQTNRQIYPDAIPLINYIDGLETLIYAFGSQDDSLTATFRGQLGQPQPLVGTLNLTAQVQFNIYEIANKAWIENFLRQTKDGQAPNLSMPAHGRKRST